MVGSGPPALLAAEPTSAHQSSQASDNAYTGGVFSNDEMEHEEARIYFTEREEEAPRSMHPAAFQEISTAQFNREGCSHWASRVEAGAVSEYQADFSQSGVSQYESLRQTLPSSGPASRPASQSDALRPRRTHSDDEHESIPLADLDQQGCNPCLTEVSMLRSCGHIFHSHCLEDWWARGGHTCPVCRKTYYADQNWFQQLLPWVAFRLQRLGRH